MLQGLSPVHAQMWAAGFAVPVSASVAMGRGPTVEVVLDAGAHDQAWVRLVRAAEEVPAALDVAASRSGTTDGERLLQTRHRQSKPSPGADVDGVSPIPVQMCKGVSPAPVQMWAGPAPVQMCCSMCAG